MAKKSGLGRNNDDFDFNKAKPKPPPKLSQIRPGDRTSFYLRPDPTIFPKDPCGDLSVQGLPNLDILGKPGRQAGESVLYDPVQKKNYLSVSDRYERSLNLLPSKVITQGNKTTYYFCSSTSPSGFWEVVVGGSGTFLNFGTPILTIICPRPLSLKDLTTIETDGDSIKWTQQQGRLTIISPSSGDGVSTSLNASSLDPDIFIIGNRTALDPPVLILAELEDNPEIFDFLVINTTAKEIVDGVSGMEKVAFPNTGPQYQIPPRIAPIPTTTYQWVGGEIEITWNTPSDTRWITEYQLQQNINGTYQTIDTIPANGERRATVSQGNYYRLLAINNVLGIGYAATESNRFYFPSTPPYPVFGSESLDGLSGSERAIATQYDFIVTTIPAEVDTLDGVAGSERAIATQYPLSVITIPPETDTIDGVSGSDGEFIATVYNLTGGIVG